MPVDDEALGSDARLTVVDRSGLDGRRRGRLDVGGRHHDEGVAAPELEHGLLDLRAGAASDRDPGALAPRQGHRGDARIVDEPRDAVGAHEKRLERSLRKAGLAEDLLDGQGAVGDVRSVLEEADVAGHEGRRGEAEDLPEGEVPRHHGEHGSQGVVADQAAAGIRRDGLLGEKALRVLRVVAADPGALLGLGDPGIEGLAHLERHPAAPLGLAGVQDCGGLRHLRGALGPGGAPPARKLGRGERDAPLDLGFGVRFEGSQGFPGRGIDGGDRHGSSFLVS